MISPEQMIDVVTRRFGVHPGYHVLHAKGAYFTGTFTSTAEAAALTTAAHMQGGSVPVIARLSNGGGDPTVPDYVDDVRGLAVGFELGGGERTDILAQTSPRLPVGTPEAFAALIDISKRDASALVKLPLFLLRNPKVVVTGKINTASLRPPASFASRPYYAFHAFKWIAPGGSESWVRYTWIPADPAPDPPKEQVKAAGPDYLFDEIIARLAAGPARWTLKLQIATDADDPHDPTTHWPDDQRETVDAGVLELTTAIEPEDPVILDPMRLTDGIEASDDPILQYRPAAYGASYERRTAT